jgi:hypothetical protein
MTPQALCAGASPRYTSSMTSRNNPAQAELEESRRNALARAARQAELDELIAERKQQQAELAMRETVARLGLSAEEQGKAVKAYRAEVKLTDSEREILEIDAQLAVFKAKLERKKKPLGWARRQAMKQQVAELQARRSLLKKNA